MPTHRLIECDWPQFDNTRDHIISPGGLHARRLDTLQTLREREGYTHVVVYADREHFANLHFLTGFDPRFEEALLILTASALPLLLVGNECAAYLPISPLFGAGQLRHEVYGPFSLQNQPRSRSRGLAAILAESGIDGSSRIAAIGWKTYNSPQQSDLPSYIVDSLRELSGPGAVHNSTGWLTHPAHGLRTLVDPYDIAVFEYNNVKASEAMRRLHFALRPGITDQELLAEAVHYDGTPLSCHMTCKTGPKRISLASASGNLIERGNTWSANIAYWGANICRSNWVASDERDIPARARGYLDAFAGPYFVALADWLESLRPGASCAASYDAIHSALPHSTFHIELNPGHHIHYDEWPGSPFYPGSDIRLTSGMVLQSDVIPSHPVYGSTRMEDGYAIADPALLSEFRRSYPHAALRVQQRRAFLRNTLSIAVDDSLLPLSNTSGIIAPWGLSPRMILARAS